MKKILLAMIAFMFVEITGFIVVGNWIGVLPTLLLIICTSIAGAYLLKRQGTKAVQEIKMAMANGQPPGFAMIDGLLIFLGAVFLIFPGFVTDLVGLLMLTPARGLFKPAIFYWLRKKMKNSQTVIVQR